MAGRGRRVPLCAIPGGGLGAVTTRKAWANKAKVMCRYHPGQRRTW